MESMPYIALFHQLAKLGITNFYDQVKIITWYNIFPNINKYTVNKVILDGIVTPLK